MQAYLVANPGYSIECVDFVVAGNYLAIVRQENGDSSVSGSATTATVVSVGCNTAAASIVQIDAFVEYPIGYVGDWNVLGYHARYIQSTVLLNSHIPKWLPYTCHI